MNDYRGRTPDINLAKFFVLNAKMLKFMRFGIIYAKKDRWLVTQRRKLQLDKKASAEAKFEFRTIAGKFTEFLYATVTKGTYECSVADPFEGSC